MSPGTSSRAKNDSTRLSRQLKKLQFHGHIRMDLFAHWLYWLDTYQRHSGGTSFFSSSKLFSDRYSWMNATVTTMRMAIVILAASSYCFIKILTSAEPIENVMRNASEYLQCPSTYYSATPDTYPTIIKSVDFWIVRRIFSMLDRPQLHLAHCGQWFLNGIWPLTR